MNKTGTGFAFDALGNLLWSDDGQGRTIYTYDDAGRLATTVYPDGNCLALGYDRTGNVVRQRLPGGSQASFAYDGAGRLVEARYGDGTVFTYRYDEAGHLREARAPGCVTAYDYDLAGRPVHCQQTIAGATYVVELAYNQAGHLTGVHVPGCDSWLRYRYDEQQRLVGLGHDDAPDLVQLTYDEAGRQVSAIYANGVTQRFALGERHQLQRIDVAGPDGQSLLDLRYRMGAKGDIVAVNDRRYIYDAQGRLVEHGPLLGERVRYRYDSGGNRLEEQLPSVVPLAFQYDRSGRLAAWHRPNGAVVRCGYDTNGNLRSRADGQTTWAYHFDDAGRLVRAVRNRQTVADYGYDHNGRRVLKRSRDETVISHRDPWGHLLAESTSHGDTRVYLGMAGQHLACLQIRNGEITTLFLHPDHLGSWRVVTDAQGQVVAQHDFDPFGKLQGNRPAAGSSPDERRPGAGNGLCAWSQVFAGHPFDVDLEMYDAGARWCDPAIGRFISPDSYTFAADDPRLLWLPAPAEARGELRRQQVQAWQQKSAHRNRYVYALNNPLTYVDHDGHNAGLYFLYSLLSIFWALPYTLVGFLFFEVWLNWVTFAWLWDWDNHRWAGESSDRLGAWAWWTIGGVAGRLVVGGGAFTLGNFVIANHDMMNSLDNSVHAYGIPVRHGELVAPVDTGKLLTERQSVIEHELRHTNQYGWWGPFMMPWVLLLFFLFQNLVLTGVSQIARQDVHVRWREIVQTLFGSWWQGVISGAAVLLLPGAYWWDLLVRGGFNYSQGYARSWFEQNAAQHSGSSNALNLRAAASQDSVAPGGAVTISVITGPNRLGSVGLTVTTNVSGAPAPTNITPPQITNLRVYRYTAGATTGTDVLTASDSGSTFTLEITVR